MSTLHIENLHIENQHRRGMGRRPHGRGIWLALVGVAACAFGPLPAHAETMPVLRATLANGLRVIIVRNTLAPVVATSVNYLVGSDEAPAGFPGMAHAQEHMMFRGSPGFTADQLADIGSVMGGNFNANTRESLTQYLFTVPAEDLDVALHIEALRMRGVLDDAARAGIRSAAPSSRKWRRTCPIPATCCTRKLRAAMFAGTPYAHDALGTRPSFDKTTRGRCCSSSTMPGTRPTTPS